MIVRLGILSVVLLAGISPSALVAHSGDGIYAFDQLTIEQGLSQSTVQAILQDRDGLMWLGTKDGLNRYDGYNFVVYRHDPERPSTTLSDNDVHTLFQDSDGGIWVATAGGGLCPYDNSAENLNSSTTIPLIRER